MKQLISFIAAFTLGIAAFASDPAPYDESADAQAQVKPDLSRSTWLFSFPGSVLSCSSIMT